MVCVVDDGDVEHTSESEGALTPFLTLTLITVPSTPNHQVSTTAAGPLKQNPVRVPVPQTHISRGGLHSGSILLLRKTETGEMSPRWGVSGFRKFERTYRTILKENYILYFLNHFLFWVPTALINMEAKAQQQIERRGHWKGRVVVQREMLSTGVPSGVNSPTPSVPGNGSRSTVILTRIKPLLKMDEGCWSWFFFFLHRYSWATSTLSLEAWIYTGRCSSCPGWWPPCVGRMWGVNRPYQPVFHETWWKHQAWAKEEPIKLWSGSESWVRSMNLVSFSLSLRVWPWQKSALSKSPFSLFI